MQRASFQTAKYRDFRLDDSIKARSRRDRDCDCENPARYPSPRSLDFLFSRARILFSSSLFSSFLFLATRSERMFTSRIGRTFSRKVGKPGIRSCSFYRCKKVTWIMNSSKIRCSGFYPSSEICFLYDFPVYILDQLQKLALDKSLVK